MTPRKSETAPLPRRPLAALRHLRAVDPTMGHAIDAVGEFALPDRPATLHMLCSCVIGQSISIQAAQRVVDRFSERFGDSDKLCPAVVLACAPEEVQSVGLTAGKARAICALAELWEEEKWTVDSFIEIPDQEIEAKLTAIKGIGPWTAKMFLIFGLRRRDILPHEDLGLREALRLMYNLEDRPARAQTEEITRKWAPWRTVGTVYAWQWLLHQKGTTLSGEYGWW